MALSRRSVETKERLAEVGGRLLVCDGVLPLLYHSISTPNGKWPPEG